MKKQKTVLEELKLLWTTFAKSEKKGITPFKLISKC